MARELMHVSESGEGDLRTVSKVVEAQGATEESPRLRFKIRERGIKRRIQVISSERAVENSVRHGIFGMRSSGTNIMWKPEAVLACKWWV